MTGAVPVRGQGTGCRDRSGRRSKAAVCPPGVAGSGRAGDNLGEEAVERDAEGLWLVQHQVVMGSRDLGKARARDQAPHFAGHGRRQDGRVLAAHEERGSPDGLQERPAVGRAPPPVASRVEAIEETAVALDDPLLAQVVEQRRIRAWCPEGAGGSSAGRRRGSGGDGARDVPGGAWPRAAPAGCQAGCPPRTGPRAGRDARPRTPSSCGPPSSARPAPSATSRARSPPPRGPTRSPRWRRPVGPPTGSRRARADRGRSRGSARRRRAPPRRTSGHEPSRRGGSRVRDGRALPTRARGGGARSPRRCAGARGDTRNRWAWTRL